MTQMLVYSHFADTQAISNLLIALSLREPQICHSTACFRQVIGDYVPDQFDCGIIGPILICNFPLIYCIDLLHPVLHRQAADMVQASVAHRCHKVRSRHSCPSGNQQRFKDIVHYVPCRIVVPEYQHRKPVHRRVMRAEKPSYVIFCHHTYIIPLTREKTNLSMEKFFQLCE